VRYFGRKTAPLLTAQQLGPQGQQRACRRRVYIPVKIPAKTPVLPAINPPAKVDPNFTVVDYLKEVRAKNPQVRFSTRWWDQEPLRTPLFALIGWHCCGGMAAAESSARRCGRGRDEGRRTPSTTFCELRQGRTGADIAGQTRADRGGAGASARARGRAGSNGSPAGRPPPPRMRIHHPFAASPDSRNRPRKIRKLDGGPLETTADNKPKAHKKFGGECLSH
jgi:hypothetical protein